MTTTTTKITKKSAPFTPMSIDEAEIMINDVIQKELAANWSEEQIKIRIRQVIEQKFEKIVSVHLGFDSKYGDWEIDHCNGRAGNSDIGKKIASLATNAVDTTIAKMMNEGKFQLAPKHIKALEREFDSIISGYEGRKIIQSLAMKKMEKLKDLLEGKINGATN